MSYNTPNRNYPVPDKGTTPYYEEIKTTFNSIDNDVQSVVADLNTTEGNISTLQSDVSTLQSDMTTAQSDISTAQSDIIDLQNTVDSFDSTVLQRVDTEVYEVPQSGVEYYAKDQLLGLGQTVYAQYINATGLTNGYNTVLSPSNLDRLVDSKVVFGDSLGWFSPGYVGNNYMSIRSLSGNIQGLVDGSTFTKIKGFVFYTKTA